MYNRFISCQLSLTVKFLTNHQKFTHLIVLCLYFKAFCLSSNLQGDPKNWHTRFIGPMP